MFNIFIEKIPFANLDTLKFNSSNHHDLDNPPLDYDFKLQQTNTKHWIQQFHKCDSYQFLTLSESDATILSKCNTVYDLTGKISNIFKEDIDEMALKYNKEIKWNKSGYFVRTEDVSLKYGMYGNIPHTSMKTVLESIITCPRNHGCIKSKKTTIIVYFLPWISINTDLEFRVFVKYNKITAISQQHCYRFNQTLRDENILQYINLLIHYFYTTVIYKITHLTSYCMDICILTDFALRKEPYFIEINPFGKEYSSGSALFHWLDDEEILYGTKEDGIIHVRYC
jgi:hypothetical protein